MMLVLVINTRCYICVLKVPAEVLGDNLLHGKSCENELRVTHRLKIS